MHTLKDWTFYLTAIPFIYVSSIFATTPALAAINKPKLPDGSEATDNIVGDLGKVVQGVGKFLIYLILLAGYAAAAYMIITGAIAVIRDRDGSGVARFIMGILVAIVMVLVMTYFLSEGESALANFTT